MKLLLPLFALALSGCGASDQQLHARAVNDLDCPEDRLKVLEVDDETRVVSGCGRQATYVEHCDGPKNSVGTECKWSDRSKMPH